MLDTNLAYSQANALLARVNDNAGFTKATMSEFNGSVADYSAILNLY